MLVLIFIVAFILLVIGAVQLYGFVKSIFGTDSDVRSFVDSLNGSTKCPYCNMSQNKNNSRCIGCGAVLDTNSFVSKESLESFVDETGVNVAG